MTRTGRHPVHSSPPSTSIRRSSAPWGSFPTLANATSMCPSPTTTARIHVSLSEPQPWTNATPSSSPTVNARRTIAGVHPCHELNLASMSGPTMSMVSVESVIPSQIKPTPGTRARSAMIVSLLNFWTPSQGAFAETKLVGPDGTVSRYGYMVEVRTTGPAAVGEDVGLLVGGVVGAVVGGGVLAVVDGVAVDTAAIDAAGGN